jgi:hypothetical protein
MRIMANCLLRMVELSSSMLHLWRNRILETAATMPGRSEPTTVITIQYFISPDLEML